MPGVLFLICLQFTDFYFFRKTFYFLASARKLFFASSASNDNTNSRGFLSYTWRSFEMREGITEFDYHLILSARGEKRGGGEEKENTERSAELLERASESSGSG